MPITSSALIAAAPAALQTVGGIFQSIFGGSAAKKAQNALLNLQTPTYNGSSSIMNYYNNALQRYNTNPYQSPLYRTDVQNANNTLNAGINNLQTRRSAVGGISDLSALTNNNLLKAANAATQQQNQEFSQLGNAANLEGADQKYQFQINKLMPYQKQFDLLAGKAAANAATENTGFSNIFNGLGNISKVLSSSNNS
jgi:hypothetical protein